MTNKQRILRMVERWPEDISYDKALYHMSVLRAIDEGLKDIEAGRTRDHDEVFDELERRCDKEAGEISGVRGGWETTCAQPKEDSTETAYHRNEVTSWTASRRPPR